MRALKAARSAEGHGGIERADRNADLRIGRGGQALGLGNVRPPLQQLRRHAQGNFRQRQIERRGRNAEAGQVVIGERADGMLVLRARHAQIDELRADSFKLRLRLRHVHRGGHAAGESALGQIELMLEVGHRGRQQLDLGIEAAQSKIVGRHLRVQRQSHVRLIGGAGLRVLARLFHGAADAAPEVRLPAGLAGNHEVVVRRGISLGVASGSICRLLGRG